MELIRVKSLTKNHCGATPKPVDYWKLSAVRTLWYALTWEENLRVKRWGGRTPQGESSVRRLVFAGAWNEKWKPRTLIYRREGDYFTWITSRPFCTQVLHFLLYFPLTPFNCILPFSLNKNFSKLIFLFFFYQFIKLIKVFQSSRIFKKYMKMHMRITSILL